MSNAKAEIEIVASTAKLPAALHEAGKMMQGFALGVSHVVGAATRPLLDIGKRAAGNVLGNLATRGLDFFVDQAKGVLGFEEALVRFGIAARKTPMEMREIGNAARKTSTDIGLDALEVLNAGRAYIDLAGAQNFSIEKMNILARAAQATGSKTEDLAGMMYQLTTSMKVPDNELEDTMGGLINQAKDGAIEAKQMAAEFAGILPLFKRFGMIGREGTIQAGAMFQVMRDGANSAGEAGTMLQRVYAGIQSYAPRFEAQGVQIYEKFRDKLGRKVLLPFPVIFKNIVNSEAMKDPALIKKMFGRTEGWRGMLLGDEASRAMDKLDASGKNWVSRMAQLEEAGRELGVIPRDVATFVESSSGKIATAVEKMKNAVAVAFTPERVAGFAALLTRAAGAFMDAANWIDSHVGVDGATRNKQLEASEYEKVKKEFGTSPEAIREMQNYKSGDDMSLYDLRKVVYRLNMDKYGLTGGDQAPIQQIVRDLGERLGREAEANGVKGSISAGMLVHQQEYEEAGRAFLKGMGWNGAGPLAQKSASQDAAGAIRDALAPSLDRLTRVLEAGKITELKLGEGGATAVAKTVDNASTHRRK